MYVEEVLGERRRRAEPVDVESDEGFRETGLRSEEARFPVASGLTFRIRLPAEALSLTPYLPGSRVHSAGFRGVPRRVVRGGVGLSGSSGKADEHCDNGHHANLQRAAKERIGLSPYFAQLL